MPLTAKGQEILANLEKEYGPEHAKRVLYAGKNKGTFTGIDDDTPEDRCDMASYLMDALCERVDAYCARHDEAPKQYSTTELLRMAHALQATIAMRTK